MKLTTVCLLAVAVIAINVLFVSAEGEEAPKDASPPKFEMGRKKRQSPADSMKAGIDQAATVAKGMTDNAAQAMHGRKKREAEEEASDTTTKPSFGFGSAKNKTQPTYFGAGNFFFSLTLVDPKVLAEARAAKVGEAAKDGTKPLFGRKKREAEEVDGEASGSEEEKGKGGKKGKFGKGKKHKKCNKDNSEDSSDTEESSNNPIKDKIKGAFKKGKDAITQAMSGRKKRELPINKEDEKTETDEASNEETSAEKTDKSSEESSEESKAEAPEGEGPTTEESEARKKRDAEEAPKTLEEKNKPKFDMVGRKKRQADDVKAGAEEKKNGAEEKKERRKKRLVHYSIRESVEQRITKF